MVPVYTPRQNIPQTGITQSPCQGDTKPRVTFFWEPVPLSWRSVHIPYNANVHSLYTFLREHPTMNQYTILIQCSVVRRATAFNTPWVLNKPRLGHDTRARFATPAPPPPGQQQQQQRPDTQAPESPPFVVENYTFTLSGDADCQELPFAVEHACGIPAHQLRLCLSEEFDYRSLQEEDYRYEECAQNKMLLVQRHTKVTRLQFPKEKGQGELSTSYVHFFKQHGTKTETNGNLNVTIVAFETTIRPRPQQPIQQIASYRATTAVAAPHEDSCSNGVEVEWGKKGNGSMIRTMSSGWGKKGSTTITTRSSTATTDAELGALIEVYGNGTECRIYDTEALPIARAISQSLWPRNESELRIGLRVDAMDHTGKWYPGTIVDIARHSHSCGSSGRRQKSPYYDHSNSNTDRRRSRSEDRHRCTRSSNGRTTSTIRVHFDNFSSKWDEIFTLDQLFGPSGHHPSRQDDNTYHRPNAKGMSPTQVIAPLYTQVLTPRTKPTEFLVHHRYTNRHSRKSNLFGQSFLVQCQSEWSTVRAAAHIIAQASRFLNRPQDPQDEQGCCSSSSSPARPVVSMEEDMVHTAHKTTTTSKAACAQRLYDRTQRVISDLLDKLIDFDRHYVQHALGLGVIGVGGTKKNRSTKTSNNSTQSRLEREQLSPQRFRNPGFDATPLMTSLHECLKGLLRRLPFELLVCTKESLLLPVNKSSGRRRPEPDNDATHHHQSTTVNFPLSLERTIGNYMNGHLVVILQWREPPSDSTTTSTTVGTLVGPSHHQSQSTKNMYLDAPVMYVEPSRRRVTMMQHTCNPLPSRKDDEQQPSHPKCPSPTTAWEDRLDRTKSAETSSSSASGSGSLLQPTRQPKVQHSRGPIRIYRYMQ
jgi:hypothetical protein